MRTKTNLMAGIAMITPIVLASPAAAQSSEAEVQTLRDEVQTLKQQLATLAAKVDATETAQKAVAKTSVPETKWKGAPETSEASGFSFKPRGRVQIDVGSVQAPSAVVNPSLGTSTEFRRVYFGADGTIPGGFGYRVEAELANSAVELTDVWLTYKTGKTTFTVGQQKAFWGLEEMTSDLFTSFQERAAFNSAFGFERRVGLSATYADKEVLVQGGIFADNAADLNSDQNNSLSFDGRVVYSPKIGKSQLHLGGSAHYRKLNSLANSARHRSRPFVHTTDLRFVDTRAFSSTGEASFGLEAALINGPFHATLEGHQLTSHRPGLANPTFRGGYAEVGYLLTKGDSLGYKGGVYDRIKPTRPVNKGGMGAFQVSARYDYLDLSDAGIIGGKQSTLGLSLIWVPVEYVRFIANYGRLNLTDTPILAGISNDYSLDSMGLRAQIDF